MVQLHWPTIRRHTSQNALKHLASLEADFQTLDACVKLNVSKQNKLPSSFQKEISKGIFQALIDHEYPYEISEADRTLIGGLLLKHITVEAVERARDRIPLRQYRGLYKSFQSLATKFKAKGNQSHLKEMTKKDERGAASHIEPSPEFETIHTRRASLSRQAEVVRPGAPSNGDAHEGAGQAHSSRGRGRDAAKAAIAIDRPKKKGRKRKKHDEITQAEREGKASVMRDDGGILETMGNQHGSQEVDVHEGFIDSGVETNDHEDLIRMFKDTEAQCGRISLQLQDLESRQVEGSIMTHVADELMEDEDMREIYLVEEADAGVGLLEGGNSVNYPSDATQGPSGQADNQKRFERNEMFLQGWEVKEELEDPDASSLITFNIEHQAAVNQLDDMDSDSILEKLSSSLEAMRSLGHDVPHFIRFTNAMLLDNGNLEVHAHAKSKDDIGRLSRIRGWDFEFEKSICTPIRTYAVETSRISVDSFNLQTRKHKATAIRELLEGNLHFEVSLLGINDIRDIRWYNGYRKESGLIIEFRTPQQADHVLDCGILIHGECYTCQPADQKLRCCRRCQAYGHDEENCLSAHRCGKCALQHPTPACTSIIRLCANCRGPHGTKAPRCPARKAHKVRLRYTNRSSPVTKHGNEEPGPIPQSRTAARNLSSLNSIPVSPHNEVNVKVEEVEPLQSVGPVPEHHLERAAAPRNTLKPVNARHEPFVKAEGIEITQEMRLAQNQPPDLMMMQRQLEDLRKIVVERLAVPQHPQSQRKKKGADKTVMGRPSSYPRKRPRRMTQRPAYYPGQTRINLPADSGISPYAVPFPRTTYATSTLRS